MIFLALSRASKSCWSERDLADRTVPAHHTNTLSIMMLYRVDSHYPQDLQVHGWASEVAGISEKPHYNTAILSIPKQLAFQGVEFYCTHGSICNT